MGKANRRKKVSPNSSIDTRRPPIPFRERPFEGLQSECDLVAAREIIPCAVIPLKTNAEHGAVDFDVVTFIPEGKSAMIRSDGRILVGLQNRFNSGDLSHDLAGSLLAAVEQKKNGGKGVVTFDVREPAPRLQDILDDTFHEPMELQEGFRYWFAPDEELSKDVQESLDSAAEEVVETREVPDAPGMYWCNMNRNFVRYVTDIEENLLFTALARLQVAGKTQMGEGSRFVGAFRACGIAIPVFELADGVTAEDIASDARSMIDELKQAVKVTTPLTDTERRAKQGLISRQVTIR